MRKNSERSFFKKNNTKRTNRTSEEIAAGFLIFKPEDEGYKILFVKNKRGEWGPPKGKVEANENLFDCAKREVLEETGLTLGDDYKYHSDTTPFVADYQKRGHAKKSYLFMGESISDKIPEPCPETKKNEIDEVVWMDVEQAIEILTTQKLTSTAALLEKAFGQYKSTLETPEKGGLTI